MKKQTVKKTANLFASGVAILTIANLIVKVIGVMLKVPLSGILGNEGMGYYNSAYEVYVWLYMVSTAGLPVAIAVMVSESRAKGNFREANKIFKIALWTFMTIGFVGMSGMIIASKWLANNIYKLDGLEYAICAIAPTLFFICVSCAIRGYFQGYQNMTPTAVSEVIEALGKLIIGMALASYAMKAYFNAELQYPISAAFTILGLTIGVAVSVVYLVFKKLTFKEALYNAEYMREDSDTLPVRTAGKILKSLLIVAIPITISSSVMSFTSMLDSVIISNQLQKLGHTQAQASATIGYFKNQVVTFCNLPPVLIYPISGSLVPYLSSLRVKGEQAKIQIQNLMNSSLRVASLIALPCALGMSVLSGPIIRLLFAKTYEETAAGLLSVQALTVFFVAMLAMTTSMLQAYKYERKPIISMFAGAVVKIVTSWVLIGNENIQIYGAPISTFLSYLTIIIFNFYFVAKYVGFVPNFKKVFIRPFLAAVLCAGAAIGSYYLYSVFIPVEKIVTVAAIGTAAVVYLAVIFLLGAITREDMVLIPKGEKVYAKLAKLKLMK